MNHLLKSTSPNNMSVRGNFNGDTNSLLPITIRLRLVPFDDYSKTLVGGKKDKVAVELTLKVLLAIDSIKSNCCRSMNYAMMINNNSICRISELSS